MTHLMAQLTAVQAVSVNVNSQLNRLNAEQPGVHSKRGKNQPDATHFPYLHVSFDSADENIQLRRRPTTHTYTQTPRSQSERNNLSPQNGL